MFREFDKVSYFAPTNDEQMKKTYTYKGFTYTIQRTAKCIYSFTSEWHEWKSKSPSGTGAFSGTQDAMWMLIAEFKELVEAYEDAMDEPAYLDFPPDGFFHDAQAWAEEQEDIARHGYMIYSND